MSSSENHSQQYYTNLIIIYLRSGGCQLTLVPCHSSLYVVNDIVVCLSCCYEYSALMTLEQIVQAHGYQLQQKQGIKRCKMSDTKHSAGDKNECKIYPRFL